LANFQPIRIMARTNRRGRGNSRQQPAKVITPSSRLVLVRIAT